jgi:hypothetical protein
MALEWRRATRKQKREVEAVRVEAMGHVKRGMGRWGSKDAAAMDGGKDVARGACGVVWGCGWQVRRVSG